MKTTTIISYLLLAVLLVFAACVTPPPPPIGVCGDGVVDVGEDCDAGPSNGGGCTPPYGDSCEFCNTQCSYVVVQGEFCGDGDCNGPETGLTCAEDCSSGIVFAVGEVVEAEDGGIVPPMVNNGGIVSMNTDGSGTVSFKFNVVSSGDYVLEAKLVTTSAGTNSFFVSGLDEEDIFDASFPLNGAWDVVSWRGSGTDVVNELDPKIWTLNSGIHTFVFRGREKGTGLDAVRLLPFEGVVQECTSGQTMSCDTGLQGVCEAGTLTCAGGSWSACAQNVQASAEICDDGLDNDCDGSVDEGCVTNPVCGDGYCNGEETCVSCPGDCGACPVLTGDAWYVDNARSSNGDGSSWGTAWNSFAGINWAAVQPGDTIYISGGSTSKTYYETLSVRKSGTEANPIIITKGIAAGHNGVVLIDGQGSRNTGIELDDRSYIVVSGFKLKGFRERTISIDGGWGNPWPYNEATASKNIVVENMDILLDVVDSSLSERGVFLQVSKNTIVRNNTIRTLEWINAQTDGIYSQYNVNPLFENNYIVLSNAEPNGHDDCIQSVYDTDLVARGNFVWQNNNKTSNAQGIYATQGIGTFRYYNNVFYAGNTTSNGLTFRRLTSNGTIEMIGNTAFGERSLSLYVITEVPDPVFKNNIAYSKSPYGAGVKISNWAGNGSNIDYNVLYAPNSNHVYVVNSSSKTWTYTRNLGWDAHSYNADPRFVDVASMNYHLQADSPAVDSGLATSIYSVDKDGVPRPQGAGWDIGAYER